MIEIQSSLSGNMSDIEHFGSAREKETWQTFVVGIFLSPIIVLGVLGNIFSLLVWVKGMSFFLYHFSTMTKSKANRHRI